MTEQIDMFAMLEPPPEPVEYVDRPRRKVMTRAYGDDSEMSIYADEPDPFEIEVRGIPCVVKAYGGGMAAGFCTYTAQGPGSLFWSGTGFRSWAGWGEAAAEDVGAVIGTIERYIDRPKKQDGLGGKLVKWWPGYVTHWRQSLDFEKRLGREKIWAQWGPEKHKECWAAFDARQSQALADMASDGIDPDEVLAS